MRRIIGSLVVVAVLILLWLALPEPIAAQPSCPAEVGCAQLSLTPNTLLGDFFLGDQLLAAGQNAPLLQVPPGQNHQIVVRNIQSPGDANFNVLYVYQETTVRVNVAAGKVKPFKATPKKQFIRGTLNFTCDPKNIVAGEDVNCQLLIDGGDRGVYAPKQSVPFVLDPGAHAVTVQLVGGSAGLWEPNRKDQTVNITAGKTAQVKGTFDKRAHLIVVLSQPGTVGDFFINDQLIAGQVSSIDLYVAANVAQKIVVRNINPPQPGSRWLESSGNATLRASTNRTVTIRLKKEPVVNAQQTAALNAMQRTLDAGRKSWQAITDRVWTPLLNNQSASCGYKPAMPAFPSVNESVLNSYPGYRDAFELVKNAILHTRVSIQTWLDECSVSRPYVDETLFNVGVAAKNNAENFFNQAQDRINALRNATQ